MILVPMNTVVEYDRWEHHRIAHIVGLILYKYHERFEEREHSQQYYDEESFKSNSTMELTRYQLAYVGDVTVGWEIDPSTNSSLFLADRAIIMDRFDDEKPTLSKVLEMRTKPELSEEPR